MNLKNYQEDLVLYVADLVLKDRPDVKPGEALLHDVAAYALNRLPPRYIQSERGFTRLAADQWVEAENEEGLAGLVEVLLLVNRAIDVIKDRRRPSAAAKASPRASKRSEEPPEPGAYWHNLPYLIGRVRDGASGKPMLDAQVQVCLNGQIAVPADPGWLNPMRTNAATKGFFSFLPRPMLSRSKSQRLKLEVSIEHPACKPMVQRHTVSTHGELITYQYVQPDRILDLGQIALTRKSS
jgi:hypothetical protein